MSQPGPTPGYLAAVTDRASTATDTLFFEHAAARWPEAIRVVGADGGELAGTLAGASALVVIRSLMELGHVIQCAARLGVPRYYFVDDNFMLLRDEGAPYSTWFATYTDAGVRSALQAFDGVLLPTPALVDYFRAHHLHERLIAYPPIAGPAAPLDRGDAEGRPLTLAFFGGAHRRRAFVEVVHPAIARLARERDVRLIVVGVDAAAAPSGGRLQVVHQPYDPSYSGALRSVARQGIDILVHPGSDSVNNRYKNPHVLINACVFGAVPVFSDCPPYDAFRDGGVAVVCRNTADVWYEALAALARDPDGRRALRQRLAAYCDSAFGGRANHAVIEEIRAAHAVPRVDAFRRRQVRAAMCLGLGRLSRLATRAVRRAGREARHLTGGPSGGVS